MSIYNIIHFISLQALTLLSLIDAGPDGAVIGLSVAFAFSFLWALVATVISISAFCLCCC